jgi:hypothetical protein
MLLAISMPAFASRTIVTQRPYYNPYYGAYYGGDYIPNYRTIRTNHSIFPDINDLERYALNRNFTRDSDRTRLERLEMQAFGAVQQGDITTRYDNVREAILTRPKQNYKTSILRSISDYFNGQVTGFTPPISSNDYSDVYPYGKSSTTNYVTPFGKGYSTNNYGIGSSTGVHILD